MGRFDVETWYKDERESVAFISLDGPSKKVRNDSSLNEYVLVSGQSTFVIDGDFDAPLVFSNPGVVFRIPAGTVYQNFGNNAVMLCTSVPPFDPGSVTVVE